jgi:uncharacterized membrane protein YbhN (UPF0104 family)
MAQVARPRRGLGEFAGSLPAQRARISALATPVRAFPARHARTLRVVTTIAAVGTLVLLARSLSSNDLLTGSFAALRQLQPGLLALAIASEALSLWAYATMVTRMLGRDGVPTRTRPVLGTTLAGVALSSSVPGGAAVAGVYWYRALRRYGASTRQARRMLVTITLVSIGSLGALGLVGGALVELGPPRTTLMLAVGGVLAAAAVGSSRTLRTSYPVAIASLAIANWALDCVSLDLALRAVGADPSVATLVPAYALAQIVAAVPLLPGGGGTVEASLALALASFGHTAPAIVAGVVLYRLISNWGLVPIGWAAIVFGSSVHVGRGGGAAAPRPLGRLPATSPREVAAGSPAADRRR